MNWISCHLSQRFHFYITDHLGTVRAILDVDGNIKSTHDFEPYGVELQPLSDESTNFKYKYTGQERDNSTNLDFMHARFYGSAIGRFLSPDPVNGNPTNPQSWNLYTYVQNNPVNATDPTGLTIRLTGEMKQALIDLFSSEMGLAVSEDENGDLTRAQGPPTPETTALVETFDTAASSETPLMNIEAVGDSPLIQIDSFCCNPGQKENTPQVSVTQLAALPSRPPEGKSEMPTRGEFMAHFLAEYTSAVQQGAFTLSTYSTAHFGPAMAAQNAFRRGLGQNSIKTQILTADRGIYIEYSSGMAAKVAFSKAGNVQGIHYGWWWYGFFW